MSVRNTRRAHSGNTSKPPLPLPCSTSSVELNHSSQGGGFPRTSGRAGMGVSMKQAGAWHQLPHCFTAYSTKTRMAAQTAPHKEGQGNTGAHFERATQTHTVFVLGTGCSLPRWTVSSARAYWGSQGNFLGDRLSSSMALLAMGKKHNAKQISQDLGLPYYGKTFLRDI